MDLEAPPANGGMATGSAARDRAGCLCLRKSLNQSGANDVSSGFTWLSWSQKGRRPPFEFIHPPQAERLARSGLSTPAALDTPPPRVQTPPNVKDPAMP